MKSVATVRSFWLSLGFTLCRWLVALSPALATDTVMAQALPHLNAQGQEDYQRYLSAAAPKAFAIAPGGAWGWAAEQISSAQATAQALASCQTHTPQKCVLYANDRQVVFDTKAWPRLWGPYLNAMQARQAVAGTNVGQRFVNLTFINAQGTRLNVSTFKGQALILHFWGSWCGPCRREMPQLQTVFKQTRENKQLALVLLQVREPISTSRRWMVSQGLQLPAYDSGAIGLIQPSLSTLAGERLHDRTIASVFPSTFVLDKNGIVVFSHFGPIDDWQAYLPFLLDVAQSPKS